MRAGSQSPPPARGEEKRASCAAPALESSHGKKFQDVYVAAGVIGRLCADLRPAAPPLRLHALRPRRAPSSHRADRARLGAGPLPDRLLHLLGHYVTTVRASPIHRGRGGITGG